MKIFVLIIFSFTSLSLMAQDAVATKYKLTKAFTKSIKVTTEANKFSNWDSWIACNNSGLFFKSDTVRLKNYFVHAFNKPCCEQVALKLYGKHKLILAKTSYCQTSSFSQKIESIDSLNYKIMHKADKLIFLLLKNGVVTDSFRVFRFDQSFNYDIRLTTNYLTLIRENL